VLLPFAAVVALYWFCGLLPTRTLSLSLSLIILLCLLDKIAAGICGLSIACRNHYPSLLVFLWFVILFVLDAVNDLLTD
jgi:hypothetical protein